jgi:hypothetical protein
VPETSASSSNQGPLSIAGSGFQGCPNPVATSLGAFERDHLVAWHSGRRSLLSGDCAGSDTGGDLVRGYVTIDVVNECSQRNPTDPGYFSRGGNGVASNENALLGDYFIVDPSNDFAHGDTAVHLRADTGFRAGDQTFYGRYTNGNAGDQRQPLPRRFAARYLAGGAFDGSTQLTVWRDTKSSAARAVACGNLPAWAPLASEPVLLWDEEENAIALGASQDRMPTAVEVLTVGSESLASPANFGWLMIDLGHDGGDRFGDDAQGWVTLNHSALGRYRVGYRAYVIDTLCDP